MNTEQSLGEYLRTLRIDGGASLRSLAEQLKIAPSYLSDIENDRRVPADELLNKIGQSLGADINELLALAGKLDDSSERFIRKQPEAVRLFRKIAEANLSAEDIRNLAKQVPDGSQRQLDF